MIQYDDYEQVAGKSYIRIAEIRELPFLHI